MSILPKCMHHHVNAGAQAVCKSNKCSQLRSHLSGPQRGFLSSTFNTRAVVCCQQNLCILSLLHDTTHDRPQLLFSASWSRPSLQGGPSLSTKTQVSRRWSWLASHLCYYAAQQLRRRGMSTWGQMLANMTQEPAEKIPFFSPLEHRCSEIQQFLLLL